MNAHDLSSIILFFAGFLIGGLAVSAYLTWFFISVTKDMTYDAKRRSAS
jgi:hypothetical protein